MSRPRHRRRQPTGLGLWPFIRLARPHFLAGGFLLYGLGALIARYEGRELSASLYLAGQAYVTCIQLMTHFLNEYWDTETDRLNRNRTLFSGGSGMISSGQVARETSHHAAVLCLAGAGVAAFALALSLRVAPIAWAIAALAVASAWFYSSPPLQLASSGYGELATSILVGLLLPAFGYSLQTGGLSPLLIWSTLPLVALHAVMLLTFDLPDAPADEATGKRTLFVRLGWQRARQAHLFILLAAYLLFGVALWAGVPLLVVLSGLLPFPIALALALSVQWLPAPTLRPQPQSLRHYFWLTGGAVSLFALTAAMLALGFWRLG